MNALRQRWLDGFDRWTDRHPVWAFLLVLPVMLGAVGPLLYVLYWPAVRNIATSIPANLGFIVFLLTLGVAVTAWDSRSTR